ncbi:hypothetical protein NQ318_011493 [Aromia moschata]|uniref:C2H2-type domain-containing protein n=1 Tax=Aromia moschata TaxID=1265417 RepID=A0AAV8XDS2_9CUCU|nr:hypothetical protein NQ318_011493 [Aromia moschata]
METLKNKKRLHVNMKKQNRHLIWQNIESCFNRRLKSGIITNLICFTSCAVREKKKNRVTSYPPFSQVLKYDGIDFPIDLRYISKFEFMNKLAINVFTVGDQKRGVIVPVCLSKFNFKPRINLLMLQCNNEDENSNEELDFDLKTIQQQRKYHFSLIENVSRLLNKQTGHLKDKKLYCERCLNHFYTLTSLNKHLLDCENLNKTKITLPLEKNKILKFKN